MQILNEFLFLFKLSLDYCCLLNEFAYLYFILHESSVSIDKFL